jgi:putative ABC transport system ATP-binding protein
MIAKLINATKVYESPVGKFPVLEQCNIALNEGELLLIIGPSGSGKTTLLSLIGCLIYPTEGTLEIDGKIINQLSANKMASIRLNTIGFVFQQFNLLSALSAEENVAFPLKMQNLGNSEIQKRTKEVLQKVDMLEHRKKLPKQLSGGQQQRIAIARALVTNPKIILCDEPTASLDNKSLYIVMDELRQLARDGKAVAVVTHDPRLTKYADRCIEIDNGKVTIVNDNIIKHQK